MPKVSADLDSAQSFDTLEEAVEAAGFSFKCSDRLNGLGGRTIPPIRTP